MKPYLHTLVAKANNTPINLSTLRYRPAIDRLRGTQLEVQLVIPGNTTSSLTWEFDKSILRYTEYPPDANRGFDVAPAIITIVGGGGGVVRTPSLLLSLPTPDFSMPYNVIILSSTVIALAFGSVFNLLVRRFVALEPGDVVVGNKVKGVLLKLVGFIKARIEKVKNDDVARGQDDGNGIQLDGNRVEKH
jgi:phosphatidylinositol glycan class T